MLENLRSKIAAADERAVSPVIGVVLMVAITVILAATIGTLVMGMGSNVPSNVNAGVSVQSDPGADEISVTYTSQQSDSTELRVAYHVNGSATTTTLTNVGDTDTQTFTDGDSVKVVVTASDGDSQTVVYDQTHQL